MPPDRLRASNADRERVVGVLRGAAEDGRLDLDEFNERAERVLKARTLGELAAVTTDLVADDARPIRLDTAPVAALFRNETRSGRFVMRGEEAAFALFGTAEIDLRDALLVRNHVRLTASMLFGRVRVHVPEGMEVRVRGWSFFGRRITTVRKPQLPDPPVLEIEGFTILGSLRVTAPRRRWTWLRRRPRRGEIET
nr:DUF1707 domain-containing protein [Murinocardiopsis flavida]